VVLSNYFNILAHYGLTGNYSDLNRRRRGSLDDRGDDLRVSVYYGMTINDRMDLKANHHVPAVKTDRINDSVCNNF
jgi:hypothetical protein